jgi:hypothetical protein
MWPSSAPKAVVAAAAPRQAATLGRRGLSGQQPDGGAFHIALAARDLPANRRRGAARRRSSLSSSLGELQEGVAVQAAEPRELAPGEAGIVRKTRTCSPCLSLVWKPTMFHSVPSALSWRSCTTA